MIQGNHTRFLEELRISTLTGNFKDMSKLTLDCFCFKFKTPLSSEEQLKLGDFMGTSDNVNNLSPMDFCDFYLQNNISFKLSYIYSKNRTKEDNFYCALLVQAINEELNRQNLEK